MGDIVQIQGKTPKGELVTLDKNQPLQMSLFQATFPDKETYSNTIEFYDAIPKYYPSRKLNSLRENGTYLPTLKRTFKHRDRRSSKVTTYQVNVKPARIKGKDGEEKEYYPSEREELIEEVLRQFATDNLNGCYLDDNPGVQFTLSELRDELYARGHAMRHETILEALRICSSTTLEISSEGGKKVMNFSIFPHLLINSRADWLTAPKDAYCYVQFNPLMRRCIAQISYRQIDYTSLMNYQRQLARWFYKRLSHNYIHADYTNTYTVLATTIIRDSGLLNAKQFRDNLIAIENVLQELQEKKAIMKYEKGMRYGKRNKIQDVLYTLSPHHSFVYAMKAANKHQQTLKEEANRIGYVPQKEPPILLDD